MAYPAKLLTEGEEIVLDLHPHWKRVIVPVLVLLAVLAMSGFLLAQVDNSTGQIAISVVAGVLLVVWALVPVLKWRTTLFIVTNKRVVVRSGVLSRHGRDVPLTRLNDVTFSHNLIERILGCGTLVVESAGERGQVTLTDVPHVEAVQRTVYDLVEHATKR